MGYQNFDKYASDYDAWFMANSVVFETELKLVAACLKDAGEVLSIGCGSALFESSLKRDYGVTFKRCIEPAEGMAEIARKRGFEVEIGTAEDADYGVELFDTVLFNGCPCYMNDLVKAFKKAYAALRPGGRIVVVDVPKESAYGILYNLAMVLGTWDHPLLSDVSPNMPYPIELVKEARWRTTKESTDPIVEAGFKDLSFMQSLTADPHFSNERVEEPQAGYDRGSYVAFMGVKK